MICKENDRSGKTDSRLRPPDVNRIVFIYFTEISVFQISAPARFGAFQLASPVRSLNCSDLICTKESLQNTVGGARVAGSKVFVFYLKIKAATNERKAAWHRDRFAVQENRNNNQNGGCRRRSRGLSAEKIAFYFSFKRAVQANAFIRCD